MSKKGDIEINEIFIIILLLMGVLTSVWIATENTSYSEERQVKVTDQNTGELIVEGLEKASEYFYLTHPEGDYLITPHEWALGEMDEPPDSIPYSDEMEIPTRPVLFEGKFLYGIRGFGAKIYERTDVAEPMSVECVAIFLGSSDTLNEYYSDRESFMIRFYTFNTTRQILENCFIHSYKDAVTQHGNLIRNYYIHCNVIWEGV